MAAEVFGMSRCVLTRRLLMNVTLGLSIFGISVEGDIHFLGLNEGVERGCAEEISVHG